MADLSKMKEILKKNPKKIVFTEGACRLGFRTAII